LLADDFAPNYFMHLIAEAWKEMGFHVEVLKGTDQPVKADLVVLHTDITTVPAEYLAAVRMYPTALNGHVADISKRLVSENLVTERDSWTMPVIAKSNFNAGGAREAKIAAMGLLPDYFRHQAFGYCIYESPGAVPKELWANPNVVIEKFLPERRGYHYCARAWVFLGDHETSWISYSTDPVVKMGNITRRETIEGVPEELRAKREELAFDFGRFDYVEVDGRAVLFDANRTPTLGSLPPEVFVPRLKGLAGGIREFLGR
jgi:hypothetical protein